MTIQDAIKSGRPFRRRGHEQWLKGNEFTTYTTSGMGFASITRTTSGLLLTTKDILATDWEVKVEVAEVDLTIDSSGRVVAAKFITEPEFPTDEVKTIRMREVEKK